MIFTDLQEMPQNKQQLEAYLRREKVLAQARLWQEHHDQEKEIARLNALINALIDKGLWACKELQAEMRMRRNLRQMYDGLVKMYNELKGGKHHHTQKSKKARRQKVRKAVRT